MAEHILITGGAGFIGSHLADHLLTHDYQVRVLDNLDRKSTVRTPLVQPTLLQKWNWW